MKCLHFKYIGSNLLIRLITSTLTIPFLLASINTQAATASFYGERFHLKRTASGEIFDMNKMTCASNTHKLGTKLRVTNRETGKSVVVKVNDTGGFSKYGRTLDLSKAAFAKIADIKQGLVKVDIKVLH